MPLFIVISYLKTFVFVSPTLNIKIRFYFFTFIVVPFRNWKLGTDLDRGRSKQIFACGQSLAVKFKYCEAQGKGRAKGRPRKVTKRSFMDGGWWMVDILSLMLYIKFG